MLRSLTSLLEDEVEPHGGVDDRTLETSRRVLLESALYRTALEQITDASVQGCTKDAEQAIVEKSQGNAAFASGNYAAAVKHYSDALRWLPVIQQPVEAAKIHSNRAQALIKLAVLETGAAKPAGISLQRDVAVVAANQSATANGPSRPLTHEAEGSSSAVRDDSSSSNVSNNSSSNLESTDAPKAAAAAGGGGGGWKEHPISAGTRSRSHQFAAAAIEDCTAALDTGACTAALRCKVLFRRATAQLVLQQYEGAAADCHVAAAAAKQAGDEHSRRDVLQLAQQICSAAAAAAADGSSDAVVDQPRSGAQMGDKASTIARQLAESTVPTRAHGTAEVSEAAAADDEAKSVLKSWRQQQHQLEPPLGPTLHQLDLLLYHQQQQALQYHHHQQQQQQHNASRSNSQQQQRPLMRCCYSPTAGRYVTAAAPIVPGTILLAEQPIAAVALKPVKPTKQQQQQQQGCSSGPEQGCHQVEVWCDWCFAEVGLSAWYCTKCPLVSYCSAHCRTAAAAAAAGISGHVPGGGECGKPWSRLLPDEARLAARWVRAAAAAADAANAGVHNAGNLNAQQRCLDGEDVDHLQMQLCESLQQSVLSHNADGKADDAAAASSSVHKSQQLEQIVLAQLLSDIHKTSATQSSSSSSSSSSKGNNQQQQQQSLGQAQLTSSPPASSYLKCLGQIILNGIAIRPLLSSSAAERRGLGLYPVTALFNHNCNPNCIIRFDGRQLLLVCIRSAAAGDELTLSYGPQLGEQPTALRQQQLQQQYRFKCTCSSCIDGAMHGTTVHLQEAAAAGLRCRCQEGSSSSSSRVCPGAVMLDSGWGVSDGIVAQYPAAAAGARGGSSSSSSSDSNKCTVCGWNMPRQVLDLKLKDLAAAAAAADQAPAIMMHYEQEVMHPPSGSSSNNAQQQQQQMHLQEALQLLLKAVNIRKQHLHSQNQLLGYSHHQAGAAAAAAAAAAAVPSELEAVSLLQQALSVTTAEEVSVLLSQLQQQVHHMQKILEPGHCSSSKCSNACASSRDKRNCSLSSMHDYLSTAVEQFSASVAVLEAKCSGDNSSVAVAAEKLTAAAAAIAAVASRSHPRQCSMEQQQQQQQQESDSAALAVCAAGLKSADTASSRLLEACKCSSKMLETASTWLTQARDCFILHLGTVV